MKDYIDELAELREMLRFILNKDMLTAMVDLADLIDKGMVMNYKRIKEQSEHGADCGYAIKAKELFLALHERNISEKIKDIYETYIKER